MPLRSVEIRPRRSMVLYALLAVAMVIASYVFLLALAAACVFLPGWLLFNSSNFQILLLLLFGIAIAGIILWSMIPRREKFEAPGMLLDRASQPKLFAEIDAIAASLNEPVPGEVYLIGQPNAFVADRGGVAGFGSRRIMGLGLPLFSILSVAQMRAVLAHEFAHYYGGDTSLGPWVYKTKTAIVRIFENIGSVGQLARFALLAIMYTVVVHILKAYFVLFLRLINFVSRRQEYRADELASIVAGGQSLVDGLYGIHRAAMAWGPYWSSEISPIISGGSLPAIGDGFARFVAVPSISQAIEKQLHRELQEAKTEPYDTHPPLRDRIAAIAQLGAAVSDDATQKSEHDDQPAFSLLADPKALEMSFVLDRNPDLRSTALQYVSWNEIALRVTIPQWIDFTQTHAAALQGITAESLPDQLSKLRDIGRNIPDPKGMLLTPDQRALRAGQLFAAALSLSLIDAGWQLNVQPGVFNLSHGGKEMNPFNILEELRTGKLTRDAWLSRCGELGISQMSLSRDPSSAPKEPSAEQVLPAIVVQ